jgi:RNA polymerase primary sigma factor
MAGNPAQARSAVSNYLAEVRRKRPLSRGEERRLLREISLGDRMAFDQLVECNLGFVVKVAGEYRGLGLPLEDMLSEGNLGLLEAARRFDPRREVKFITYAIWWIRKAILQAISEKSNLVRVPSAQQRKLETIRRAESRLRALLGRDPSRRDLARDLGLDEREIDAALQARAKPFSLSRPVSEDGRTAVEELLASVGTTQEQRIIDRESRTSLERAFVRLSERQRSVIVMRYGLDGDRPLTLEAVGERMNLSRERVRQIEKQALEIMRHRIKVLTRRPVRRWRPR